MRRRLLAGVAFFLAILLLSLTSPVPAVPIYSIVDLGALSSYRDDSYARGINDVGQVAGNYRTTGTRHACLWSGGVFSDLGTLGGGASEAHDINNAGQVVGWAELPNGTDRAFLYSNGVMTDLGTLGGTQSAAYGINDAGEVVGWAKDERDITRPFLYSGGVMRDLGSWDGLYAAAYDINDAGQVVGWAYHPYYPHACLWSGGVITDLGTLGGRESYAYGINDAGQVVGYSEIPNTYYYHAFLYSDGAMTDLGTLGSPLLSRAYDINNAGQVVGVSWNSSARDCAFVWEAGVMYDLNTRVHNLGGWHLTGAFAINERGDICGDGSIGGEQHAFLLQVPEPGCGALFMVGLGALAVWRRRRRC